MKVVRISFYAFVILVTLIVMTGTALAQQTLCDQISTFSPTQGPTGTMVNVAGGGAYPYGSPSAKVWWDGYNLVATMPVDGSGNYSGSFPVPSDAMTGDHNVIVEVPDEGPAQNCPFTFTVTATTAATGVQPDAYPTAGVTRLPSTGLMLLLPAAGLLAAGAGIMIARRRG